MCGTMQELKNSYDNKATNTFFNKMVNLPAEKPQRRNSFGKQSKTVNHVCMSAWPYVCVSDHTVAQPNRAKQSTESKKKTQKHRRNYWRCELCRKKSTHSFTFHSRDRLSDLSTLFLNLMRSNPKTKKSNSRKNERVINSIWKKRKELAINFSSFLINLPLGGKQKTKELKNNDETVFLSFSLSLYQFVKWREKKSHKMT